MDRWQQLMQKGNQLYHINQLDDALDYYNQAIVMLENDLSIEGSSTQQAIQGWICGYHNLATTYEQQGFIERSRDALITPFRTMLALTHDSNTSPEMQLIAHRALQITLPPLLEFANKYPSELKFIKKLVEHINAYKHLH
jgi:tetratricopeptide (TPR) repeat protein